MRVVIDTNVLISAAVTGRNPEAVIQFVAAKSDFEWIVSAEILTEYKEVLILPRLKLSASQQERWFHLDQLTILIDVNLEVDFPRERKDAKFLACAIAAEAEFFITGDRDFTQAQTLMSTTIISVSLFKRLFCDVGE